MIDISQSLRNRYFAWEKERTGGCPVCGAVMQNLTPAQRNAPEGGPDRLGTYHDVGEHLRKGVPWVGYPS